MSLLSKLVIKNGSRKRAKLLGRGDSSTHGGTSGKGHKGQLARTGGRVRRGFEGGQTPLHRRSPKFGFRNTDFAYRFSVINLSQLSDIGGDVTPEVLRKHKLLKGTLPVKILARGELKKVVNVKAHAFSEAAKSAIEKAGGKTEVLKY